MTTINKQTQNENPAKGTPRVIRCTLVNMENRPSLIAFANVIYKGKVFLNNIAIRENKDGDAFISFPSKKRTRNGQDVLDENGKAIYDEYYGPASKETRDALQDLVFTAVQKKINGEDLPAREKGEVGITSVYLMNNGEAKDGLIGFASGIFEGLFFMTDITVNQPEGKDAYINCPARRRMRNGEPVKDENGKDVYENYFGPASKEDRDALSEMIFEAVQEKMNEE